jgi:hypothetical protein
VRDDGGRLRHPFQYRGARPTSASKLNHRISDVISKRLSQLSSQSPVKFNE